MGSGAGAGGMADIFDMFMGGGMGGGRGRPRERRSEDVVHKLSASLVELYQGATKCVALGLCVFHACSAVVARACI